MTRATGSAGSADRSFWMAGQWVAPGGGLPSGVMTARQVQQLICHADGVPFRTIVA